VTNLLAALFFYRRTLIIYRPSLDRDDHDFVHYGKHLSIIGLVTGLASTLDQIFLFHYAGAAELALYSFAIAIPEQMKGQMKNISNMFQARYAPRPSSEIKRDIGNKVLWYGLASGALVLAYIAGAPIIFHLLFPNYADAVLYSQIYVLSILSHTWDPQSAYLLAKKRTRALYVQYSVYAVTLTLGMLLGVTLWGLLGLVIARVTARFIMAGVGYLLYRQTVDTLDTRS
jgi:O-antigen/teichoic acid export membrane protein